MGVAKDKALLELSYASLDNQDERRILPLDYQREFPPGGQGMMIPWSPCVTSRRLRMSFLRNITSGLRSLFRKGQVDRELDEELRAYQEMATEEKMKQGLSRKDALRAVRLERGSVDAAKEVVRSGGWESFVHACWQDVRFAARMLQKNPAFALAAIL